MSTADALVLFYADLLYDYEKVRIATSNRLAALTSEWGKGVSSAIPEVQFLEHSLDQIRTLEHGTELALRRIMKQHPLAPWINGTVGVGWKQAGRLLATIGDPYWHPVHDRPRRVSELWAYCGLHVISGAVTTIPLASTEQGTSHGSGERPSAKHAPSDQPSPAGVAPSRRRGVRANWNSEARKRCWLVATSCIKQTRSPYRPVYDEGRSKYAGQGLRPAHEHARAIRLVMKRILLDLWRESKALQNELERAA